MQQPHNDFFAELKALNAQYGGQWSEQEEKDLYRQFWDMSIHSDKSAYDLFFSFKETLGSNQEVQYEHILSIMNELDNELKLPYVIGPKPSYQLKSSHNQARALAAKAKQKKRLAKKRRK